MTIQLLMVLRRNPSYYIPWKICSFVKIIEWQNHRMAKCNSLLYTTIFYMHSQLEAPHNNKAPISWWLVSHPPPTWIFCDREFYHHYFICTYVTLNKLAIGVMRIAMNTNVSDYYCTASKEPFYNGRWWLIIILLSCLSTSFVRTSVGWIMVILAHLHYVQVKRN